MSELTLNYNLIKPQATDPIDLLMTNSNWDVIDEKLKEASESGGTAVVVQSEPPADTNAIWIDPNDETVTEVPLVKVAVHPTFVENIDEMTDTSKVYVMPDGYLYAYIKNYRTRNFTADDFTVTQVEPTGNLINGNTRIATTELIPLADGAISIQCPEPYQYFVYYYTDNYISSYIGKTAWKSGNIDDVLNDTINSGTVNGAKYCRISLRDGSNDSANLTGRVDEFMSNITIVQKKDTSGYSFQNTGVAYNQSINYEVRIAALETTAQNVSNKVGELENKIPTVVQGAGQSTEAVMSQKAVIDFVNAALGNVSESDYEKVDSIDDMTDINKSYILNSTGTVWSWLPVETEVEVDKTEQIVSSEDNPAKDGHALSTSGDSVNSTHVITPYIDLYKYGFPCTLHMNGLTWITETVDEGTAIGKVRVQIYNDNQEHLLQYSSAKSGSGYWQYAGNYPERVVITDSTHQTVEFPSAYFMNSSKSVRYLRFCTVGKWADANIYVTYKGTETVTGDPQWVDTGIVVTDIAEFTIANPDVKSYVDNVSYVNDNDDYTKSSVSSYAALDYYRKDLPIPAVLKWDHDEMAGEYVVALSTVAGVSKSESQKFYTDRTSIAIYNLIPNKTYYYKVHAMCVNSVKKLVKEGSFTISADKTRMLNIDGIQNVRDIGGYTGLSGRSVKYGQIYRGSALDEDAARNLRITDKGRKEMTAHVGIKTDLDLRYGYKDSVLGAGVDYINTTTGFENYANIFKVPVQRTNFKNLLTSVITQLNASKPIYIHCQGGCDRTGTLVFLLLGLLGVIESDLAKEYELSSFSPIGYTRMRSGEKYSGMIAQLKTYTTEGTLYDNLIAFATKANDDTETGGCGIDMADITSFQNLMLTGEATVTKYTISNTLTNCANSNNIAEISSGASYSATLTASAGYALDSVVVTMTGVDVTSSVYSNGVITIPSVTGNINITAVAVKTANYTNLFSTTGSGFDDQTTKFFTNWIPYNSADNDGNGTIYHFKGMASTTTPYKISFATDANGTGETSAIYGNALNKQNRTAADYDSKVNIVQHYIEGYNFVRFECREAVPANFIITANQQIID